MAAPMRVRQSKAAKRLPGVIRRRGADGAQGDRAGARVVQHGPRHPPSLGDAQTKIHETSSLPAMNLRRARSRLDLLTTENPGRDRRT